LHCVERTCLLKLFEVFWSFHRSCIILIFTLLGPISSTFYKQHFCTKVFWAAFLYLRLRFVFFGKRKLAQKLVKLTPVLLLLQSWVRFSRGNLPCNSKELKFVAPHSISILHITLKIPTMWVYLLHGKIGTKNGWYWVHLTLEHRFLTEGLIRGYRGFTKITKAKYCTPFKPLLQIFRVST
jgi:hypothetical protein